MYKKYRIIGVIILQTIILSMLSLSPRYDLIRFVLPKTFIPTEIEEKYTKALTTDSYTLNSAIDYLNESIQGVTMPGISNLTIVQQQHGRNGINTSSYENIMKRSNVEPMHEIVHLSSGNPLEKIEKEFKVTFRTNQGLLNYFMMYETAFYYTCREFRHGPEPVMYIDIMNEDGVVVSRVKFMDVFIDGIDGLEFNYNKVERESNTFDVTFKFNNIDFEYIGDNTQETTTNINHSITTSCMSNTINTKL